MAPLRPSANHFQAAVCPVAREPNRFTFPEDLYMFPRRDGILLGGTHEAGVWSLEPDLEAKARIVSEHARIFREMRQG